VGVAGQVGTWGPHSGIGLLAVADWWLGKAGAVFGETVAAAAAERTSETAKRRMASFMIGNLN